MYMTEFKEINNHIDSLLPAFLKDKDKGFRLTNIRNDYLIDIGKDSIVCRYGKNVYKVYDSLISNISLRKIELYKEATNRASELCSERKLEYIAETGKKYAFKINPINQIFVSDRYKNLIVATSDFVEGISLGKIEIDNNKNLNKFLNDVSSTIITDLGIAGVNIIPYNIKINNGVLTCTDISANINIIRRFGKPNSNTS